MWKNIFNTKSVTHHDHQHLNSDLSNENTLNTYFYAPRNAQKVSVCRDVTWNSYKMNQ